MSTDREEAKRLQRKKLASQSRVVKVLQGLADGRELNELGRERLREVVQRLRHGEDANAVFGMVQAAGRPSSGYIHDRNFWRVVRVRELMNHGEKRDPAIEMAAQELDVPESTLIDLYKVHWREAARFLCIEADYAIEDAAAEQAPDTTDMPPEGSEFKEQ